jgi:hypothetical protein
MEQETLPVEERVFCGNSLQRLGSGLEPDPELTLESGSIANTTQHSPESWQLLYLPQEIIQQELTQGPLSTT